MDRHETKARIEAKISEWKNNLEIMRAKADAATGDAKVGYKESVAALQAQLDEMKISAAAAWDVADDSWDSARNDLDLAWQRWEAKAKSAWDELSK